MRLGVADGVKVFGDHYRFAVLVPRSGILKADMLVMRETSTYPFPWTTSSFASCLLLRRPVTKVSNIPRAPLVEGLGYIPYWLM